MYVCMYVCMYICMYVCMYVYMYVCTYMYVCMYVCTYVCTYICMYVCTYVRTYVCTYVCMYIRIDVCIFFIKHAPLQWSNTTCCNYACYWYSFFCRGCSDQPLSLHSLYNLEQYANRINPIHLEWHLFSLYIYIYPIITDQSPLIL